ncbi:MAG TPA: type II secretion system protein N [Ottowia sp.]|uniref:type II secretion system protein N n=1 Tax=Ottowia sp. TaxID=1898956 RepID=UPI002CBF279F|nr:type II secretion system protein N [Ottowia sp.]HMN19768.1 type II secretion system protein N [Ottowia sp.]
MKRTRTALPGATRAAPWYWAVAGMVLGGALVLLWQAPARWLASGLAQASGERVLLAQAQGSVWSGTARLLLTGGAGSRDRAALPGRVHWRLRPAWPGLMVRLHADCCTPDGPLELRLMARWSGLQLQLADGQTVWPAAVLAGLGTPFNTIQPRGELTLATQGLRIDWLAGRVRMAGTASLTARDVSSRLTTLQPMGSYRLQLYGGEPVSIELSTLEGALRLAGRGQWAPGAQPRFRGEASAAPGLEAQLANLLNILGQRRGDRAILSFG